jgi:regulator of protease activity HflC (stomatin/prohibitin superfamily)
VVYFRVVQAEKAVVEVADYLFATSQISQTTLRSILGQSVLDEILAERDKINQELQKIIDERTEPWGIKVTAVEVKQVDLPIEMQRAIAIQAQAERERRAKVIHAEGEFQASEKLSDAAGVLQKFPVAIQLRFLQTLTEISSDKNSTILFPVPIDLITPFIEKFKKDKS